MGSSDNSIEVEAPTRVVSIKINEEIVYKLDRYAKILGFRNRSELMRTMIDLFLTTMEELATDPTSLKDGVYVSVSMKTPAGLTSQREVFINPKTSLFNPVMLISSTSIHT